MFRAMKASKILDDAGNLDVTRTFVMSAIDFTRARGYPSSISILQIKLGAVPETASRVDTLSRLQSLQECSSAYKN